MNPKSSMNHKKGKVLIFSAPSGAGKSTIVRHLMDIYPFLGFSISATSRQPRGDERDGVEYYFMSDDQFKDGIKNNLFVEYEEVYSGHYYGTLKSELERIWAENKIAVFDIDVQGGMRLKSLYGGDALSVFIMPPSLDVLRERLTARGTDSPEAIEKRIMKAEEEMSHSDKFDLILLNDSLERSKEEIAGIVRTFCDSSGSICADLR